MDGDTRGLGSRADRGAGHPTRRLLVLGGAAAGLALLVDHGLRVETPQPPPPVPTRRPAPDEALLLSALAGLERLRRSETAVLSAREDALVRRLRTLGDEQVRVLRGRLTNAGVPTAVIDAAVTSSPDTAPTTSPTASSIVTTTQSSPASGSGDVRTDTALAQLMVESLRAEDWEALAASTAGTRQLLAAAYAQRLAGALLLGAALPPSPTSPVRPQLLGRTQSLLYAFEVVAAQSTGAQRRTAQATLTGLGRLEDTLTSTSSTEVAGWSLPYPVTTAQAARRLATDTLSSAVDAAAVLGRSDPSAPSLEDAAHWSARLQALAVDWNLPLTAFPGAST
ncbi:hypothetical protein [Terrabacter sp. NPDC080008]|uniref:hypothetical protein n=1 Tax=Terrabacter sp. NPDC080008 TaxID=3155176 RepID=UPI00344D4D1A